MKETISQQISGKCSQCGDECDNLYHIHGEVFSCFTCRELENNRRLRLHNQIGESTCNSCGREMPESPVCVVEMHNPRMKVGEWEAAVFRGGQVVTTYGPTSERMAVEFLHSWANENSTNLHFHWPK